MTVTPFHDLDAFQALPRSSGLALSPDGRRLVTSVATLDRDGTAWRTAWWEVDAAGEHPARRLTRGAEGESQAAFLPDGSLLFVSKRPDPSPDLGDSTSTGADDEVPLLWLLPADGGEARVVGRLPQGIRDVRVAEKAGSVVLTSPVHPSAEGTEADAALRRARREKKVSAILHDRAPVRFWDADLGPGRPHLFIGTLKAAATVAGFGDPRLSLSDLAPDAGDHLEQAGYDVSPDGTAVATTWQVHERGAKRSSLVVIDVATGERRTLLSEPDVEFTVPRWSPDGSQIALSRMDLPTPHEPPDVRPIVVRVSDGQVQEIAPGWDRWPASGYRWTPDGAAVIITADEDGRAPVFRLGVDSPGVTRLTGDDFAYTDVCVSPDGATVYALRSSYAEPPRPVHLDATTPDQASTPLPGPCPALELPGRLEEVETTAEDGARVRGWLALPEGAAADAPAPLVLWIHGGPLHSWNQWSWRWAPWLLVAQGYAVLLPDPALSTGYGRDFIARGWGAWGAAPYTDLMAITDEAESRPDIDDSRTAAMGGSFGGYMANWIAGHTDRFDAIVTHASLWALEQFGPTTDAPWYWAREMTPEMAESHSPHRHVDAIVTPMLVIHGDRDYRVPIGEALRLWTDLARRAEGDDGEMPHRFLYFPDENHWILTPSHSTVWYETVLAFLAQHVLGEKWVRPELLG